MPTDAPQIRHRRKKKLTRQRRRLLRAFAATTACGIVGWHILFGNVLSLFCHQLGFAPAVIGMLFLAIQAPTMVQIWAARYFDRHGCKPLTIRLFHWGPVLLIPLLVAPQLGELLGSWATVAAVFLSLLGFALVNNWANAGWMPLLRFNLPEKGRLQMVGRINQVGMVVGLGVLIGCVLIVSGSDTPLWRYQMIFLIAVVVMALRANFLSAVQDVETLPAPVPRDLWSDLGVVWADLPFRRLMTYIAMTFFATGLVVPFRPLYLKALGFSDRFAYVLTVPFIVGIYSLAARSWGWVVDRYGSRGTYGLAGIGAIAGTALMLLPRGNSLLDAFFAVAGIGLLLSVWPGIDAANILRMFTIVPRENQSLYMAFYTICTAGATAGGAFVGGLIVRLVRTVAPQSVAGAHDFRVMFLISATLLVGATLYTRKMRDLHEISPPQLLLHLRLRTQRRLTQGVAGAFIRFRRRPNARRRRKRPT